MSVLELQLCKCAHVYSKICSLDQHCVYCKLIPYCIALISCIIYFENISHCQHEGIMFLLRLADTWDDQKSFRYLNSVIIEL